MMPMSKVLGVILVLCALLLILGCSSLVLLHWATKRNEEVLHDEVQELLRAQTLDAVGHRAAYLVQSYLLTGNKGLLMESNEANSLLHTLLVDAERQGRNSAETQALLRHIEEDSSHLETRALQLVEQRQHEVSLEALARTVDTELDPLRTLLDGELDRLVTLEQLRGTSAAFRLAWGLLVGAMLFASGLVWTAVQGERTRRKASEFERQLVGIVTHDLRSPLTAILLATRSLLRKEQAGPATSTLERIERSARRIESVTHLLLDFTHARLGAGIPVVPEPVDLQALCHDAVEEARTGAPGRFIQEEYAGDLQGQWDAARLAQVLANLLQNALKYSPPDTPVQVRATAMEEGVRVEVHNQGEPIPRELRPRLFEPFQSGARSAEAVKKSLGLGLYIVREIVQAHAGSISVRSEPGLGSIFTLTLPRLSPARWTVPPTEGRSGERG
jgi:signal transduction histidine kinase